MTQIHKSKTVMTFFEHKTSANKKNSNFIAFFPTYFYFIAENHSIKNWTFQIQ
jgi:hypothetical protein